MVNVLNRFNKGARLYYTHPTRREGRGEACISRFKNVST
jgi:hypothetical protein